jgi:hypothetical protein
MSPCTGFFNYIADMSVFSLPPTEHFPQMPNGDYNMVSLTILSWPRYHAEMHNLVTT